MPRHFLEIGDLSRDELVGVLRCAHALRSERDRDERTQPLRRRTLAMLFEKPSLRTRVSFEQGMLELGGAAIVLGRDEVGLGKREAVADVGRVLGGMVHGIAARVFDHRHLVELAGSGGVPVINMLSDRHHPAQALADALTLMDAFSPGEPEGLAGRKVAFVGDGDNNVARSLAGVCAALGVAFACASPAGHRLEEGHGDRFEDPREAVAAADAVYADTFVSMGSEDEKADRLEAFGPYRLDEALLDAAAPGVIALHCLPAYRGVEVTNGVLDGPRSRVFEQAHNRLHAQKGLLAFLLGG
ncbi:ornithine carbamoyltransferase [Phycisphaera mikurensis]|uniref:Ornithine carbamoyltransferase n=1 Tax=Phycisphaera mikurensis (strain NBRC 102666 / KCTC 22515 / FYK2301M01) TaxID=1142394 RepID=I0IFE0_PHYMF|nr:ornithine carbamoyltransferase [Phycisphaera mikurensis]MBB6440629.1 ornithine carbamoyltransferase [Phycisphaera mikurensis]BAM03978.1 ornithine carbamoyltransferase [Phycisphaera mikurensis NBRC 102666]